MKSDSQLQKEVMEELKWEPSVHGESIGVEVTDGVVTLAGHVGSYGEKWNAERAAQRVAGVTAVAVEMDVKLAGSSQRTDADIARTAENVLQWTTFLPNNSIKVLVEKGWLTLSGQVNWEYERQTANDAVRHLMGVTGVSNQIILKPSVSLNAIKVDIEDALKRRAKADAKKISIEVNGTDVTLTGTVHNWSDKELATHAAWSTPGVHNVIDKISIVF
jgi:osmotically-inducible protein OsmY